ncbi:MAG: hypothetical protein IJ404_02610 [Clostridia bacterium]|nr:hypothetical protein [Clostridia bacterium]
MKKFSRVFAAALMFMILVTGLVSSFSVSAATVSYQCDLDVGNIKSGQFEFMAYDIANQMFYELETTSKATWSPDWPGHFVPGKEVYTVSKSEISEAKLDLMCDPERKWGAAVVFTAPAAGKYNIVVNLNKYSGVDGNGKVCYVDVMLVKGGDGTVLREEKKLEYGTLDWKKLNVQLAANEKVYILVTPNAESTKVSSQNVALTMFLVNEAPQQSTKPNTTNPDTTDPDTTDPSGSNSQITTDPSGSNSQNTTTPVGSDAEVNDGDNDPKSSGVNPILIVGIVGGVLVLAAIAVVVILNVKNKKK